MLDLKNKKILVTGGTGFIGRVLVADLIKEGAHVICLTRQNISSEESIHYVTCDLRTLTENQSSEIAVEVGPVDYILYLAASIPTITQEKESMIAAKKNNLDPLLDFLNVFGGLSEKLIFTSSIDVHGAPEKENFTEEAPVEPLTPYAVAKYAGEIYFKYYCRMNNKKFNILRFSQVYGPGEPLVRVTPIVIQAARDGKEFTLRGGGKDKRRFLYVKDAVDGLKKAMARLKNDVFIIGGKEGTSIADIVKVVEKTLGTKMNIKEIDSEKPPRHILPSSKKVKKALGFESQYSFESGVQEIIHGE